MLGGEVHYESHSNTQVFCTRFKKPRDLYFKVPSSQNTKKAVDVRSMLKNLAIGFIRNSGQI